MIYTGIEIGVHWEYFLGCVNNKMVIRYTLSMMSAKFTKACFQGNPANAVCLLPNVFHLSEPESMNGKTNFGIGDLIISDKLWCSPLSLSARPHASHLNQHLCLAQREDLFIVTRNLTDDSLPQVLIIETKHDLEHRPHHHHQAVHRARQHMEEGEEWSVVNIEAFC